MVRLIEKYLTEDIEAVKRQFSYIPEDEFDFIIQLDPTFNPNSNSVGKYGKWLLGLYKKNDQLLEDALDSFRRHDKNEFNASEGFIQQIISDYDRYKNDRTKTIEKDISRFRSIQDMGDAVSNAGEAELSKKQLQRQAKKDKPYYMVFDGKKYAIFVPKNHEGDMILASFGNSKKAKWCTAADSENGKWRYDYYLQQGGKYYVLINKNDYEDKYQFHFESNQFMDTYNTSINLNKFWEENHDIVQFFQGAGYLQDWYEGKDNVQEIVNEIAGSVSLGGAWFDVRPKDWELLEDFLNKDFNDEIIQMTKEVLPEFNDYFDDETINDFITKFLLEKSKDKTLSRYVNNALSNAGIDSVKINYYNTFQGYIDSDEAEEDVREFMNYTGNGDYMYTYDGVYDLDAFRVLVENFCLADFSPDMSDVEEDDYDDEYDRKSESYGYDLQEADTDEVYFCYKHGEDGAGKIKDVMKYFLETFCCGENLQDTITQFSFLNFKENCDLNGAFKDYDTGETFSDNTWLEYEVNPNQLQFEEVTGVDWYDVYPNLSKIASLYIEGVPEEKILSGVYTQKDMYWKALRWIRPEFKIAVTADGGKYAYFSDDDNIRNAWIKKLGLENAKEIDLDELGNYNYSKNESYKKRLKLREK